MKTVLGPWIWRIDEEGGGRWAPPAAGTGIDLRSLSEQASPGQVNGERSGVGLFWVEDDAAIDSDFEVLGHGSMAEIRADQRVKDLFPSREGFRPTGTTLAELLWEALTVGSCPDGSEFARPLIPGVSRLELHCGGHCHSEAFDWGKHPHTNCVRDVIREDFRVLCEAAHRGELKDELHHCRCLDFLCGKYGVDWQEFVPPDLVESIPGRVSHETTYQDDFVRANGPGIGRQLTWATVSGTWSTISNSASVADLGGAIDFWSTRAEHDLSGADMHAAVDLAAVGAAASGGVCVRFSAAADTRYTGAARTNAAQISKYIAGTQTLLAAGAGWLIGDRLRLQATGSTLDLSRNGVPTHATTDTSISGHLRTGLCGKAGGRTRQFVASDSFGSGVPGVYFRRRRAHR